MKLFKWMTSSLRAKLLSMFIILTAVPLLVVGLISYQKSYSAVSNHSKASAQLAAEQLARSIDTLFEDAEKLLELGNNPQVLQFLYSQSETYEEAKSILQTFQLYRDTNKFDNVLNISMVNFYGKGISERKGVFQLDRNPLRNPHFQYLTQYPDVVLRLPYSETTASDRLDGFDYSNKNALSIIAAVTQRITHEVIGFIIVDLDDSLIERTLSEASIGKTGFFYIMDGYGSTIFQPPASRANPEAMNQIAAAQPLRAESDSFVLKAPSKQFVVYGASKQTGWTIIGVAPLKEIVAEAYGIRQLIILSVLLSAVFALTLYFFLTNRITRPIQILMNKMRKAASGYLDAKVKPNGDDEIADLGNSFNIMLDNIKNLMEKSRLEQERVQMAELRTLQAQINPHFLYNALDSILWMAEDENKESVIKLVKALSRFFRLSLNKGRDWVSIKTELEHAENYLVIQQMRYRDILQYRVDVDPSLQVYPIMKMSLQPLVENAIYHGIKNKRGLGMIRIGGYSENDSIVLAVEDNGIGIPPEKLASLREELEKPADARILADDDREGGFGLANVHHRIRLYFGYPFGIELDSEYKIGSKISIRIPKK
ncbi:sensor histidine kinase [Cohnella thailandensis]|uniref:histidine kinase n=1 Tax=Cohnella thailandensis TaxID=557557 RepID=A0A841T0H5_9BACL|nr:sensor histidine kinase [Cohnella thailandensis]MBB6636366.1 sensor histidine kinase [Cohnella thailandensis]MBP1973664.1 two-component system sensor histidine kinase YesM [Cohnella thailandensis]